MQLNGWAMVALIGSFAFASCAYSQPAPTGGPTPSPPGAREGRICRPQGWRRDRSQDHGAFRPSRNGNRACWNEEGQLRPPSSADRYGSAAFGPADPERREPSSLWRRADGSRVVAAAGPAHAAAFAGRRGPCPTHAADLFREDSRDGRGLGCPPAPLAQTPVPGARHPSPAGARVYIVSPENGAYVATTFTVRFGLEKMGVAPAGVDKANTGHHHLLIDAPLPPLDEPIPNDENHLHFGGGQTETTVTLPKGRHTLQLLLGDALHVPHQPPVYSNQIVVNVGMSPPAPVRSTSTPVRRHRLPPHHHQPGVHHRTAEGGLTQLAQNPGSCLSKSMA